MMTTNRWWNRLMTRITQPPGQASEGSEGAGEGAGEGEDGGGGNSDALSRWMSEARAQAEREKDKPAVWRFYASPIFAELWYAARDAGERLRTSALRQLYTQRAHPGGAYPDARAHDAAFSAQAILTVAARLQGLDLRTTPAVQEGAGEGAAAGAAEDKRYPLAWLVTYPHTHGASIQASIQRIPPQLWLHPATTSHPIGASLFAAACLLGYVTKEGGRILDASAPPAITTLPSEPGVVALMHQFAIALLHLEPDCPPEWGCHCNAIRAAFTAPPADHDQPTETLRMDDLRTAYLSPPQRQDQRQARPQE